MKKWILPKRFRSNAPFFMYFVDEIFRGERGDSLQFYSNSRYAGHFRLRTGRFLPTISHLYNSNFGLSKLARETFTFSKIITSYVGWSFVTVAPRFYFFFFFVCSLDPILTRRHDQGRSVFNNTFPSTTLITRLRRVWHLRITSFFCRSSHHYFSLLMQISLFCTMSSYGYIRMLRAFSCTNKSATTLTSF